MFLSAGDLAGALAGMLVGGRDDYARFAAHGPTLGVLQVLMERVGAWAGTGGLGNSVPQLPRGSTPT